jgi:hypothetical protein
VSLEFLLLLAVVVLLPLIQQLLRAARQRDRRTPERAEGQPAPAERPAMREPQPPRPAARHTSSAAMTAREGTPAPDAAGPVAPALTAHRSTGRRTAVVSLRNPLDLRRAIVLMTMLGPCRATKPHDWRERAAHR